MQPNDKSNEQQQHSEMFPPKFCRGMRPPQGMPDCCAGMVATEDCRTMMSRGMKACRWFPLIPMVAGIGRVLCMVAGGTLALCGLLGLMMAGRMRKMCCG